MPNDNSMPVFDWNQSTRIPGAEIKNRRGPGRHGAQSSVLDTLQVFLRAVVVVEEGKGGMVFLRRAAMVALPFE
jgi:hypothetical protein